METAIREILNAAVWAPSGDNSQPWFFFVLRGNKLRIYLDSNRDNPILNFKLSGTYIAHGALIENIFLAAPLSGLSANVRILPDPGNPFCTAELTFSEASSAIDPLAAAIKNRHTNRKSYKNRSPGPEALTAFSEAARPVAGPQLFLTEDRAAIRAIASASALMEQIALETPALRALFVNNILWTEEENRIGKQGLYIKTMELPLPARFLMRHFSNPIVANLANAVGFAKIARLVNTTLYASAPVMGLITVKEESQAAYLAAGRSFERIWLEAARRTLAFQPVTGILFLARSIKAGNASKLLSRHVTPILEANTRIKSKFGAGEYDIPLLLFRTGYAAPATAYSFRRATDIRTDDL